jgi:hypothetical protein
MSHREPLDAEVENHPTTLPSDGLSRFQAGTVGAAPDAARPERPTSSQPGKAGLRRVNANFAAEAYDRLEELAALRGTSLSEVLRQAIALLYWFETTRREGGRILVERDGQLREVIRM